MKAKKVLRRLTKIEAMISDVMELYLKGSLLIRKALEDAKPAINYVKAAVSSQAPSGTAKNSPVKRKKATVKKVAANNTTQRPSERLTHPPGKL